MDTTDNKVKEESRTDELIRIINSQVGLLGEKLQPILSRNDSVEKNPPKGAENTRLNTDLGNINANLQEITDKISI